MLHKKVKVQIAILANFTKYLKKKQRVILPKFWKGGNTFQLNLWDQYCPDAKAKQKNIKLQKSIYYENRYKNSQHSISKCNQIIY